MIVDKVNKYLSSNNLISDESISYEVARLSSWVFKRQFMGSKEDDGQGKIYLSGAGKCARQLAYAYHGIEKKGKEMDSRSKIVFFQGDLTELMIVSIAKLAGCNIIATGLNQGVVKFPVNGREVEGHPDGLLLESGEILLVELKSMSSYGFKDFQGGVIDENYLAQVNCYMEALDIRRCVFIGLNKDSGVLHEMVLTKDEAIVKNCRENLLSVLNSTKEKLPKPKFKANEKTGFLPWQCRYCSHFGICKPNAKLVLVGNAYKLCEKNDK